VTTLYEMLNRGVHPEHSDLLAFAPSFPDLSYQKLLVNDNRNTLDPLKYNKTEVDNIVDIFGGIAFKDERATKKNFLKYIEDYEYLHLSTHAEADLISGDYSWIAFTGYNEETSDGKLMLKELYNYK